MFKFITCQEAGDYYFSHFSYNIGKPIVFIISKLHLISTVPLHLFTVLARKPVIAIFQIFELYMGPLYCM
jgi:hypothetical protein